MARPSKYRPEFVEQACKLCKLGLTDKEIAKFFEVSEQTLNTWKQQYPEFLESLKGGKTLADAEVASKLFHRATGYEHPDTDIRVVNGVIVETPLIKHYPPDTTAAIFWLKNRRPDLWRDKVEPEDKGVDLAKVVSDLIGKLPN
ncbi:transposase [Pseudomonas nitroreducens]|uniref:transposase n=1 Tax=Pseudomonas nitroreducens TaxID=46680 RepID=UPI00351D2090